MRSVHMLTPGFVARPGVKIKLFARQWLSNQAIDLSR
jgi:hypothetical protein